MRIFKDTVMSIWDVGIIKLAVGCMGIAIGATWPNIFAPYSKILFVLGLIAALYAGYSWINKK